MDFWVCLIVVTPTEKWAKRRNCAGGSGLLRTVEKALGLIGAVRFLEGYYLLVQSIFRFAISFFAFIFSSSREPGQSLRLAFTP